MGMGQVLKNTRNLVIGSKKKKLGIRDIRSRSKSREPRKEARWEVLSFE